MLPLNPSAPGLEEALGGLDTRRPANRHLRSLLGGSGDQTVSAGLLGRGQGAPSISCCISLVHPL